MGSSGLLHCQRDRPDLEHIVERALSREWAYDALADSLPNQWFKKAS